MTPSADRRIRIEPLRGDHVTAGFDCGARLVNAWLGDAAALQALHLARTFVAVDPGGRRALGFYVLHGHHIQGRQVPAPLGPTLRPDAPIGCVHIAAFGVDRRHQGHGIGGRLFADALRRVKRVAAEVGVHAVVLDALDAHAAAFYRRFGFDPLAEPRRLWLRVADIP